MDEGEVVAPILLERRCDGGQADMPPQEWASLIAQRLNGRVDTGIGFWCGTRFQWWWGSGCWCPGCGRAYDVNFEMLKRYRVDETDGVRYNPTE
jgi:hypothetical protein